MENYVDRLRARLRLPDLPGTSAQLTMAPTYRSEVARRQVHEEKCKDAAVLILLIPNSNTHDIVLTVRRSELKRHAGQISFPGGRREPGETLLATALRECEEEVGVAAEVIEVLGALTPLYIPPSHFCVYPFVGVTGPVELCPDIKEVQRILTLPLARLLADDIRQTHKRTFQDQEYDVPHFVVAGEVVWGATAMVLAEFAIVADEALNPDGQSSAR